VANLDAFNPLLAGVFEDGTFRQIASYDWIPAPKGLSKLTGTHPAYYSSSIYVRKDGQIGKQTNWLAVAANKNVAVTLRADGTLWKWTVVLPGDGYRGEYFVIPSDLTKTLPTGLSTHSDWVAVGEMMGGIVSLAADGSLYLWRFESPVNYDSEWNGPLLDVSRRPVLLGNVFSQTN
jgi:hypothetical protein